MKTVKNKLDKWFFHYGEIEKWERDSASDIMFFHRTLKAGGAIGCESYWKSNNDWTEVSVPHDWCCDFPSKKENDPASGYKKRGIAWYYTEVAVPKDDCVTIISFEGVANHCELYVNGTLAARNFSGYTGFEVDISDYVIEGEKATIALRVSNEQWEGWWYEGAGIYRPVSMYFKPKVFIKNQSTFVNPVLKDNGKWEIQIQTVLCNHMQEDSNVHISFEFSDFEKTIAVSDNSTKIEVGGEATVSARITAKNPMLWSPDTPNLYNIKLTLGSTDDRYDEENISFGFRTIEWKKNAGMLLNGRHCVIKGICCHQDHGGVGVAISEDVLLYRIKKLKAMGANAYRCAHHNPSAELLQICDRLGMLVMAENRHFSSSDETLSQVEYMVKNCRNHPCVFIYALFNEEPWQGEIRGKRIAEKLKETICRLDGSRAVSASMDRGVCEKDNASEVLDVAGFNYQIDKYEEYHKINAEKVIIGTENGPVYATRGVCTSDEKTQIFDNYAKNCPGFGNLIEDTLDAAKAAQWVAGVFLWSGFDYRGEPTPYRWPSEISHWGLTDNCGFEKDIYYLVKAYYSDEPVVHILPHWNHSDGQNIRVAVFTNCEKISIFINGRLVDRKSTSRNRAEFFVPYEKGELRAEGIRDGVTVEDSVKTAGDAAALSVEKIEGKTDIIINASAVDKDGSFAMLSDNLIQIETENGILIGSANGNPCGHIADRTDTVPLFYGKCQFIVRKAGENTTIRIKSKGFKDVTV